jgi:MFS family permease
LLLLPSSKNYLFIFQVPILKSQEQVEIPTQVVESLQMNNETETLIADKTFLTFDYKSLLLIGGCLGAWFVGYLVNSLAPIFMQAYGSSFAISQSYASYLLSIEFLGAGLATIFLGAGADKLSKRSVALTGCLLAIAANILSVYVDHYWALLAIRLLAGIGTGSAVVGGAAAVAKAVEPGRIYGVVNLLLAVTVSITVIAIGYALEAYGKVGLFGVVAAVYAACIPLIYLLPTDAYVSKEKKEKHKLPVFGLGLTFVFGYVIAMIGQVAGWVFAVKIGEHSGLNSEHIGKIIGVAILCGAAGALIAAAIGSRFGRALPATAGISVLGFSWVVMCLAPSSTLYPILVTANVISFYFCVSFMVGVSASLDQWGRWASITAGATMFGSIFGPAIGGLLVQYGGIKLLGGSILFSTIFSLSLILFVIGVLARKEQAPDC